VVVCLARLGIAGTIDRLAPIRDKVNRASHGEVIAALVAHRLTSPTPLLHVETWAREWAVEEVFGLAPDVLNDDRVGRALDALAPVCEAVVGSIRRFLLVGDTKLVSYPNLAALTSTPGVTFLAPAPKAVVPADVLASQDWATATILEFVAARDQDTPVHERASYRAREGVTVLRGPRKKDPPVTVRTVFIWSSANDQAAKAARALKLGRAREALDTLTRAAGSHHLYRTEAQVKARVAFLATKHRVSRYLVAETSVDTDTGKPALAWHFDQDALDAEAATDGWYALLTNLDDSVGPAEVLALYKGQGATRSRTS
jgi:hypothetical protein